MTDTKACVHASFSNLLDSPEFLLTTLHIIVLIGLPFHIFGAFCIIFKTPPQMVSMKWVMLNLHLWSAGLDVSIGYLIVPFLYNPVLAGYTLGLLNTLGVSTGLIYYFCAVQLAGVMLSVVVLFETRFYILYARETVWRHFRRPWLIANYLISLTYVLPTYLSIPDQKSGKEFQFSRYPCFPPEVHDEKVFILTTWSTGVAYTMSLNTAPQQATLFVFLLYWQMRKSLGHVKISKKTMEMQRKFLKALVLQVTIPVVTVICPLIYSTFATLNSYYNQGANNLAICVMATHGIVSSVAMIYLHKSYWDTFRRIISANFFVVEDSRIFTVVS